jgi:hypothetical protein
MSKKNTDKNLWILTEERPKNEVVKFIKELVEQSDKDELHKIIKEKFGKSK